MNTRISGNGGGFITMIVLIIIIVGSVLGLSWWRVNGVRQKQKAREAVCHKINKDIASSNLVNQNCN